ncbi:phosphatase PAP2 family protein [Deinococcus malanensis]|uniref:phosphatase PAP2 family protein n=1 Tax=Deinococcus malanensis TaxID=1706855 RepID=UPI003626E0CE
MSARVRLELLPFLKRHWKALALLLLGVLTPLVLIANLIEDVFRNGGFAWDQAILDWYRERRTPEVTATAQALGTVAGVPSLPIITLLAAWLLALQHRRPHGWFLVLSVIGATLLNLLAKAVFSRPRPDLLGAVLQEPGFSFPSGHSMSNAAFSLAITLIFWRTRVRWPVALTALVWAVCIGSSRNYLGSTIPPTSWWAFWPARRGSAGCTC